MKNLLMLLILFSSTLAFAQTPGIDQLKFGDAKYFFNIKGKANKTFNYIVNIDVAAVEVISTDGSGVKKDRGQGRKPQNNFGSNKPLSVVTIPVLYNVNSTSGNTQVFQFGRGGAEGSYNSAEVTVAPTTDQAGGQNGRGGNNVKVGLSGNEFYSYPGNGAVSGKKFLYVNASNTNKVKISIPYQTARGKVFVCIFNKNSKNLIKALNPKGNEGERSFVTNQSVYVIPVIAPKPGSTTQVIFEVGDPRRIAMVEVDED